jgi:hypothetical protein
MKRHELQQNQGKACQDGSGDGFGEHREAAGPGCSTPNETGPETVLLTRWIRDLPDLEPPPELLGAVMRAVQRRPLPWWRRLYRWARAPRSFTWSPLQLVPIAALLLLASTLALRGVFTDQRMQLADSVKSHSIPVSFHLNLAGARTVAVIGSFNDWQAQGYEMQPTEEQQNWVLDLQLPAGRYEYAFLVDGQRIVPDPRARFYQDDGFGNQNGVLIIGNSHETNI